jgi:hypothetical protein
MGVLALLNLVKDNRRGLLTAFGIMAGGLALLGVSTLLLQAKLISGFWWMTLTGLGSYLAYVPYGSVLSTRSMASTRVRRHGGVLPSTSADAIGYTGSVGVQLYKDLGAGLDVALFRLLPGLYLVHVHFRCGLPARQRGVFTRDAQPGAAVSAV